MTALLLFLAQAAGVIVLLAGLCLLLMLSHSLYERYQFASERTRAQREALAEASLQGWNLGTPPLNERLLLKLSHPVMDGDVCVGRITDHREDPDDEPELYGHSGNCSFLGDRVVGWMRLPGQEAPPQEEAPWSNLLRVLQPRESAAETGKRQDADPP